MQVLLNKTILTLKSEGKSQCSKVFDLNIVLNENVLEIRIEIFKLENSNWFCLIYYQQAKSKL